jgi:hypothetical protein
MDADKMQSLRLARRILIAFAGQRAANLEANEMSVIQESKARRFGIKIDRSGLHLRQSAFICGWFVPYSCPFAVKFKC